MSISYKNGIEGAPGAIGPYSQATVVGNLAFLSGQVPIDPSTGKLVDGDIEQQAEQVMSNLSNVLQGLGLSFADVAKTTILLADMKSFGTVNEIYAKWMGDAKPARATFAVAGLPLGAMIEVEMIAETK
ncbi:MAG: Rid family detoxifying hydrolase [Bdellovibrionales bacterium]|nr:Rid family detoxifying hydrolase [Bdellovibrionales bacterium]